MLLFHYYYYFFYYFYFLETSKISELVHLGIRDNVISLLQMTALDSEENDDSSVYAILTLLSMGIKSVPADVLQLKFSQCSKTLLELLAKFAQSENVAVLRPVRFSLIVIFEIRLS